MSEIDAILAALLRAPAQKGALVTLVAVEGSSYRRPGARLLLLEDGTRVGSISGGCLEDDIVLRAERVLASGTPETATYDTTQENDLVWGVGLGCSGVVRLFLEPIAANRPRWVTALAAARSENRSLRLAVLHHDAAAGRRGTQLYEELPHQLPDGAFVETVQARPSLVIFGAGDDAQPLARMASEVGWRVTVVDSRSTYARADRFPTADLVLVARAEDEALASRLDAATHVVVMTHRFAEDVQLLSMLLVRPLSYVGVLGPRKRTDRLLSHIREQGIDPWPETLAQLWAPIGLDLGGTTPETVALSIVAELQCARSGRTAGRLRDRLAPIHG